MKLPLYEAKQPMLQQQIKAQRHWASVQTLTNQII